MFIIVCFLFWLLKKSTTYEVSEICCPLIIEMSHTNLGSLFGRALLIELNNPLEHYDCTVLSEPQKQEFTNFKI